MAEWLNLGEVADLLGVHPATVRSWADKGELPTKRTAGGHRRFRRADVEARLTTQASPNQTGAQVVIDTTMGRMRFHLAELAEQTWYEQIDERSRRELGVLGRRTLLLLQRFLVNDEDESLLTEAQDIGVAYEATGRLAGLTLTQTVRAYLYFREFLFQTHYDMVAAAGTQGPTDWGAIHNQMTFLANEILLALVAAHERVTSP